MYIAVISSGYEKYEFYSHVVGAFKTESKAVHALFNALVNNGNILRSSYIFEDFPSYEQIVQKHDRQCSEKELIIKRYYMSNFNDPENLRRSFIAYLKSEMKTCSYLKTICQNFDDTYYSAQIGDGGGWSFVVSQHRIDEV